MGGARTGMADLSDNETVGLAPATSARPLAVELGGAVTVIDWSAYPEPWDKIGPRFRRECESIARGESPVIEPKKPKSTIRQRRERLGLTGGELGLAAGYGNRASACAVVSTVETGRLNGKSRRRIELALDRLEAEHAREAK